MTLVLVCTVLGAVEEERVERNEGESVRKAAPECWQRILSEDSRKKEDKHLG